jgi:pimeloyl-ACP methyl ester carboxylesterase
MKSVVQPHTHYAPSGDVKIAYQVLGAGPLDLVFVMGWVSNIDEFWTEPSFADFLQRLATFSRLILFDKRGTGLSDRVDENRLPALEQRMDDVRAVMDACGSRRAALLGISEGGPLCALFAATYPERTVALLTFGSYGRFSAAPDYPWGRTAAEHAAFCADVRSNWGEHPVGLEARAPSRLHDDAFRQWWTRYLMRSASPKAVLAFGAMNSQIDVRAALPVINAPSLIMHRTGDRNFRIEGSRYLARSIRGAKFIEFPGDDHLPWTSDAEPVLNEIQEFLTGSRHVAESDRVLATVMFIDIAGSTHRAAALGDRAWSRKLERFWILASEHVERHRGREIDTAGDSYFAIFDGPARAVRCAQAIARHVLELGFDVRAGLHTGEVEMLGAKVSGIAVHIGARIAARAVPGEVLVSSIVKDLVAGSGLRFEDRGEHALQGVGQHWRLYVAVT